ncbi:MAG: hypothetical protein ACRCUY_01380 [Thermoguttaceae bacterium]
MYVKDQFMGVLENLNESQLKHLMIYAQCTFSPTPKSWDDIEEDEPTDDEVAAYQRFIASMAHESGERNKDLC